MSNLCDNCKWFKTCSKNYGITAGDTPEKHKCKDFKEKKRKVKSNKPKTPKKTETAKKVESTTQVNLFDIQGALKTLEDVEATGFKRNIKVDILVANKGNQILKELFDYTYNWRITYGITIEEPDFIPKTEEHDKNQKWLEFKILLEKLNNRELTGHAARDAILEFLTPLSALEIKWYVRVINRDLKIKTRYQTYAKAWPDLEKPFQVYLANKYEPHKNSHILEFPVFIEPKFDGMRITIIVKDSIGKALSRGGHDYSHIIPEHVAAFAAVCPNGVLECEVFGDAWNDTVSIMRKKEENYTEEDLKKLANLKLYCFDYTVAEMYDKENPIEVDKTPFIVRRKKMINFITSMKNNGFNRFIAFEQYQANSEEELDQFYNVFLDDGHEGMMLKTINGFYVVGRSNDMLKYKPEHEIDGTIVGFNMSTSTTTYGTLKSFQVELEGGVITNCSGLKHKQKKEFWEKRDELLGMKIEMLEQVPPKGKEKVAKTRFPRFKRFKLDH